MRERYEIGSIRRLTPFPPPPPPPSTHSQDVTQVYALGRVLGKGQFGTTRLAEERGGSGREMACKSIAKRKLTTPDDVEDVRREVQIMHHLKGCDQIVALDGAFEDRHNVHLVMELCSGGELFDAIVARGKYSEADAAAMTRSIVRVVAHCHSLGVIHRDLKPENFLLSSKADDAVLKATDFGLSSFFKPGQVFTDIVGSAYYVAPEVLKRRYGKEADIWSCGVILYILLSGVPPFWGETEQAIFDAILKADLDLESDPWPQISDSAKDCVRRMLDPNPKTRATADAVLQHEWMKENGTASSAPLDNVVLTRMRGFAGMNKLKKEALKIIAQGLSPEEIAGLRTLFESLDADGSGSITVDELREGLARQGSTVACAEVQALLKQMDVDGTGTIDYPEFLAATLHAAQLEREDNLVRAFAKFDADGSGTISKDELAVGLRESGVTPAEIDAIVAEADADGDGTIDYEEFSAMMLGKALKGAAKGRKGAL